jgi:PEP-CTERM motif
MKIMTNAFAIVLCSGILLVLPVAQANTLYDNIPSNLSSDVSWAYQADETVEFGGLIKRTGGSKVTLESAVVAMSDWAVQSAWQGIGTSAGFVVPLTLNLYNVGPQETVGSLFDTVTVNALIPWRPEADPVHCGAGTTQYLGSDGACHDGSLSTVTFSLGSITAPKHFIYGLAYNTENWGADPTGVDGPYNSLNFSLSTDQPTIGKNVHPDTAYLNTSIPDWYSDGGPSGTFRQDQGWTPYSGAIEFFGSAATPEPSTFLLIALGLIGLGTTRYRRKGK